MSITLDTTEAKRVTALATRATEPGHPILSAVHIGFLHGRATLTSRSLALAIETAVDATTNEHSGCILVGAKRLADVIGRCPGDSVTLTPTEGGLIVTSGRWKATIPTIPPAEYDPYLIQPETDGGSTEVFHGDGLLAALAAVTLAASPEHSRPLLAAVHMAPEPSGWRFVATDSYRLATRSLAIGAGGEPVNIPADTLRLLASIHTPGDEIELATTARSVRIQTGNTTIVSQLIEGKYPDWQNLVGRKMEPTGLLTVEDPEDLAAAVTRSGKTFGGDMGLVKLTMHPDAIDVEASAADVGIGTETVPATWTGPDGFAITFNSRLLAEGLRSFAGPVVATVADELKPTVLRSRHSHLLEVLSDLWRETTTADQRHHIERALDAAELDARNWYR
jgi:DNA polymerase-3 subunit beta